jgi:transcription antitermination protein NusB
MLNRHFIRAKVLQSLYSFQFNDCNGVNEHNKKLLDSFNSLLDLHTYLFSSLVYIHSLALEKIEDNRRKLLPTSEDLNPNTKFVDNEFIALLINDKELLRRKEALKINWNENRDLFMNILKKFNNSNSYKTYMNSEKGDLESEKNIYVQLFKNYLISNENYFDNVCEMKMEWESDYDTMALWSLKSLKEYEGIFEKLSDNFVDENFISNVFKRTIENDKEYTELINAKVHNWDVERVALMDILIIKMGLSELIYCPEIPINVTLNEYVELSKEFSTPKSKLFVNGLLDKLMVELRAKGRIKKLEEETNETDL